MRCDQLSDDLAAVVAGEATLSERSSAHVEHCLRCQAEVAQHRRVLRALRTLRTQVVQPSPGLVADVLDGIEALGERSAVRSMLHRHRVAYVAAVTAAGAAGAAGAIVIASRSRRTRLSPTG